LKSRSAARPIEPGAFNGRSRHAGSDRVSSDGRAQLTVSLTGLPRQADMEVSDVHKTRKIPAC